MTTCPAWCTWQANEIHVEGNRLDEPGAIGRLHARTVAAVDIAGQPVEVDLIQGETVRPGGAVELAPIMVSLSEVGPVTASEARKLAWMLLHAAEELEAVGNALS